MADNPLVEAKINSLDELMSRNPLEISDDELDQQIRVLRSQRAQWLVDEAAGAVRPKAVKKTSTKGTMTIADLEIKL